MLCRWHMRRSNELTHIATFAWKRAMGQVKPLCLMAIIRKFCTVLKQKVRKNASNVRKTSEIRKTRFLTDQCVMLLIRPGLGPACQVLQESKAVACFAHRFWGVCKCLQGTACPVTNGLHDALC